jgi:hypothetical protein
VGTFDEAFKSRIQLNLPYKMLDQHQRHQIWKNCLDRLATTSQVYDGTSSNGINTTEILKHLDELAKHPLNGREIRNAISTARQLAAFRGKPLCYEHLAAVIGCKPSRAVPGDSLTGILASS